MTAYFPPIPEFELRGVYDAGVPNKERVILRVAQPIEMGNYALLLGVRSTPGHVVPISNSAYWFGSASIPANDWVMVYTGAGQGTKVPTEDRKSTIWIGYWGRPQTVFHDKNVIPVLWRLNGIAIERSAT